MWIFLYISLLSCFISTWAESSEISAPLQISQAQTQSDRSLLLTGKMIFQFPSAYCLLSYDIINIVFICFLSMSLLQFWCHFKSKSVRFGLLLQLVHFHFAQQSCLSLLILENIDLFQYYVQNCFSFQNLPRSSDESIFTPLHQSSHSSMQQLCESFSCRCCIVNAQFFLVRINSRCPFQPCWEETSYTQKHVKYAHEHILYM